MDDNTLTNLDTDTLNHAELEGLIIDHPVISPEAPPAREPQIIAADLKTAVATAETHEDAAHEHQVLFQGAVELVKRLHEEFLAASAKMHADLAALVRWP